MIHRRSKMVYLGSREVSIEFIQDLARSFDLRPEDRDELYLKPFKESYSSNELLELLEIVGQLRPDECDIREGELRLWWD